MSQSFRAAPRDVSRDASAPGRIFRTGLAAVTAGALALMLGAAPGVAQSASEDEINRIIRSLAPIAGQTVPERPVPESPADALTEPAPGTTTQPPPTIHTEVFVEVNVEGTVIVIDPTHSMDFEVYFEFDSAELTGHARAELTALGRALESGQLRPYRYLIAGHTDAVGNPAYNQRLSERRAASVRNFLITNFAIDPTRLVSVGFGEERLKDPANPRAAINRRVEVAFIVPREWR